MKKNLCEVPGTVAYAVNKRIDEINFSSLKSAKASLIAILRTSDIKQKDLVEKYCADIDGMRNLSQLMSTVTTYLTCQRV